MAVPEERNKMPPNDPKAAGNRLTRAGLSPTVEKMFGALVDRSDESREDTSSESEALRTKRLGAA